MLHGEFRAALRENFLMPVEALYVCGLILSTSVRYIRTGKYKLTCCSEKLDLTFLVVFVAWWILRNILNV